MYKLKQVPEDFKVKEKLKLELQEKGTYAYYQLHKKNYTTSKAIETIAKKLNIKLKLINSAGLKDKAAVTTQYISIFKGPSKDFSFTDIYLKFIGRGEHRINVGSLEGNYFEITVRNIMHPPKSVDYVPNYFDKQRFGLEYTNHVIGRHLVKNEFSKATELIKDENVHQYLQEKPNDYVGALRQVPKRKLQFYVSAYQSYIWNLSITRYLNYNPGYDEKLPVVGFNVGLEGQKGSIIKEILDEEGLKIRDFVNRAFPELSCDGYQRRIFTNVQDLNIAEFEDDELNQGYRKVRINFFLEKGNYATNVINYMFS